MQTDPLADFLTTIRNAARASKSEIRVPWSRMRSDVAHILKNEGYVLEVEKVSDKEAKAGKPELREYKAVYVLSDAEIGLFSDEVVVNCAP